MAAAGTVYVLFRVGAIKDNDQRSLFYPAARKHRYRRRKIDSISGHSLSAE